MFNEEIPREQWERFLDDFSQAHQGEHCRVELLSSDLGDQPAIQDMPLVGITLDTKGTRQGAIEIMAGDSPDAAAMHVIGHPTHVRVERDQAGPGASIEIEAEGEPTALIRLCPPGQLPA